jgi:uncharacterized membrane protein YgcG
MTIQEYREKVQRLVEIYSRYAERAPNAARGLEFIAVYVPRGILNVLIPGLERLSQQTRKLSQSDKWKSILYAVRQRMAQNPEVAQYLNNVAGFPVSPGNYQLTQQDREMIDDIWQRAERITDLATGEFQSSRPGEWGKTYRPGWLASAIGALSATIAWDNLAPVYGIRPITNGSREQQDEWALRWVKLMFSAQPAPIDFPFRVHNLGLLVSLVYLNSPAKENIIVQAAKMAFRVPSGGLCGLINNRLKQEILSNTQIGDRGAVSREIGAAFQDCVKIQREVVGVPSRYEDIVQDPYAAYHIRTRLGHLITTYTVAKIEAEKDGKGHIADILKFSPFAGEIPNKEANFEAWRQYEEVIRALLVGSSGGGDGGGTGGGSTGGGGGTGGGSGGGDGRGSSAGGSVGGTFIFADWAWCVSRFPNDPNRQRQCYEDLQKRPTQDVTTPAAVGAGVGLGTFLVIGALAFGGYWAYTKWLKPKGAGAGGQG